MKKSVVIGLLAAAGLYAGAPEGKALYDKSCKACHGADGKGNPGIAKALKVTMRPLGSKEVQAKSDAQLKKDITEGNGKMKPVPAVAGSINDVIAFVRTLK